MPHRVDIRSAQVAQGWGDAMPNEPSNRDEHGGLEDMASTGLQWLHVPVTRLQSIPTRSERPTCTGSRSDGEVHQHDEILYAA